jgi:hypothetical protein
VHVLSVRVSGVDSWSHVWPLRPSALNSLLQNSLLSITHRIHSNAFVYILVRLTKSIVTSASIVTRRGNALFSLLSDNCCRVSGETPNMLQYFCFGAPYRLAPRAAARLARPLIRPWSLPFITPRSNHPNNILFISKYVEIHCSRPTFKRCVLVPSSG